MAISSNTKKLLLRIVLFLVYLLLGATVFHFIEHKHEKEERDRNDFHKKYKNFTDRYKISKKDMVAFIKELEGALKLGYNTTSGFNGSTTGGWPSHFRWQFMNAFHFAGNVVTTIGYGHIAPITFWGRFLCIIYALVGIPLTGLTLRSIGNRISEFIAATIKTLDRRIYNRETEKIEIKTALMAFAALWFIILIPAAGFSFIEKWDYEDAVYFCFVTLTTIGFGDFVPGQGRPQYEEGVEALLEFLNLFYMVLGLAVMSGVIVSISGVIEEKTKNFGAVDPLEALRNIRVENLNSRALKKLGYKMGPGMGPPGAPGPPNPDATMNSRLPPKLAPKAIPSVAAAGNDRIMERSRSAEAMDFQGPTPVMYLNKRNGNIPSCGKDENKTGSPTGSKMFNNKIAPVTLPENQAITNSPSRKLDLRKRSEHNSTSTESAEEARASDEDSEVKTINELNELREEAELDACEPVNHEPKNNLVIQVQVTPMPSPRESPVHTRPSIDSISTSQKNEDPDIEPIETYEGSLKGSIDSSNAFQSDRTTAVEHSKINETFEKDNESPVTNPFSQNAKEKQNPPHKAKTNDVKNNPRTKNGIVPRNTHSKPNVKKQGRTFKPVEHIDLGDKTISKVSR